MSKTNKSGYILLAASLSVAIFILLFTFRYYDDNRLTSWQWVFEITPAWKVYLALLPGLMLAYILSAAGLPASSPAVLFVLSFAAASVFWGEPEVIIDAGRYFTQAKYMELYGIGYFIKEWGRAIGAWTDLPLVPFIYGLIFKFFGEARLYIQIFTTTVFSLTVVLTYYIGKDLWGRGEMGFRAGALLLGMPYLYSQVPLMLSDVPAMFFLVFTVFSFNRAIKIGGVFWTTTSSAGVFSVILSKYSLWPMLSVLIVMLLVEAGKSEKSRGRVILRALPVFLIAGILSGAFFLYKSDVFMEQMRLLFSYQRPGLKRWSESHASTFLFQIHPFITAFAAYSIYRAFKKRDWGYVALAWLPCLMFIMGVRRIRYLMPVFPFISLMASYGLSGIRTERLRNFIVSSAVIVSFIVAVFAYLPFLNAMSERNLKDAGRFLNSLDAANVEVFALSKDSPAEDSPVNPSMAVPMLDLFTKKRILYNETRIKPPSDVMESALRFTWEYKTPGYYAYKELQGKNTVIVIVSAEESPDSGLPAGLQERVQGWARKDFGISTNTFRYRTVIRVFYPIKAL